jgi:hypothetical protein
MKYFLLISLISLICFEYRQEQRITKYQDYYNNTEVLLDSIDAWYPDFADLTMETDTYYEYEVCRDKIMNNK